MKVEKIERLEKKLSSFSTSKNVPDINRESTIMRAIGTVDRDGYTLQYCIEGEGMTALVIGSALYYPRTFSQNLRNHFKLIFIDHRGFAQGPETRDVSKITLDLLLEDIEYMRKQLKLERFVIIGHSGHGYMALEYAKKYSHYVSHVVLIGMGPDQSSASHQAADRYFQESVCPGRKAVLEENLVRLPHELQMFPEKRFITFCIRLGARSWYDFNFDAAYLWQDVQVKMPIIDHVWGTLFRDIDITKGLDKLNIPVFLALGKFDFLVAPFYTWETLRPKFKNLTVKLFEKSGHTPQLEEAELFDQELLWWLSLEKKCE